MKIVGKIRKSEKVCGYWRCNKRIPDNSFLCAEHYEDWDEGLINQCPVCNRFKDVMHYLCPDCFGGRSVVPWKPHVRIPPSKQQHEVEYSEARANGKSQIATRAGEGAGYSYSWMDSHLSPARCFVYILEFDDGQFYVGHTIDLRKQLAEHRKQKASSLTGRNP